MYFSQTLHVMHEILHGSFLKDAITMTYAYTNTYKKRDAYSIHNSHAGNAEDVLGYAGMYLYALHSMTKS